jgi:hypothetical protein
MADIHCDRQQAGFGWATLLRQHREAGRPWLELLRKSDKPRIVVVAPRQCTG